MSKHKTASECFLKIRFITFLYLLQVCFPKLHSLSSKNCHYSLAILLLQNYSLSFWLEKLCWNEMIFQNSVPFYVSNIN